MDSNTTIHYRDEGEARKRASALLSSQALGPSKHFGTQQASGPRPPSDELAHEEFNSSLYAKLSNSSGFDNKKSTSDFTITAIEQAIL